MAHEMNFYKFRLHSCFIMLQTHFYHRYKHFKRLKLTLFTICLQLPYSSISCIQQHITESNQLANELISLSLTQELQLCYKISFSFIVTITGCRGMKFHSVISSKALAFYNLSMGTQNKLGCSLSYKHRYRCILVSRY